MNRDLLLFGARTGTGLELARLARAAGWRVTAMIRPSSAAAELIAMGCAVVEGDALDRARVGQAFSACAYPPVVVSTLGGGPAGRTADHLGNAVVIDAARAFAAPRMLLVTSLGCGNSRVHASERLLAAIGDVLLAKTRAEDHLRTSGVPHVVIRPGGLVSDPPTGQGAIYADARVHGRITRPDLAAVLLPCLTDARVLGRTLSAIDRTRLVAPDDIAEFPLAAVA
ncbi:NAD(P)H-binding protein [Magnetospirillum sp. SS-4]|uniref:NAD(P)H-binding protein n=1 Tax=Magnetospirillum sp. SS-4 TaxID=2681465 RepID=UPI0013808658|nr:NAD(P)H-binding protein [Magnetospirillum sp. SS-4]CAA7620093.1 conserved hypothetical protein [Magnetospirillum sp. SS-4]